MKPGKPHSTAGLRVVLCSRGDCSYAGEKVDRAVLVELGLQGYNPEYYWCCAETLTLERREKFGLPCASFSPRVKD